MLGIIIVAAAAAIGFLLGRSRAGESESRHIPRGVAKIFPLGRDNKRGGVGRPAFAKVEDAAEL